MDKDKINIAEREPAVAGRFYPGNKAELIEEIDELRQNASKYIDKNISEKSIIRALLVPHAGYVFSGTVASAAYAQLESSKQDIKRVFLLGSSHHAWFEGASVYPGSAYKTPLGNVKVDTELCNKLIEENIEFSYVPDAHAHEHCLEVQLPFLQNYLVKDIKIVPILLGNQTKELPERIASILQAYFCLENLFIISTDLSHYPEYNEAHSLDKLTINAFCQNDTKAFLQQLKLNDKKHIPHLSTSMCGWMAALTLLYLAADNNELEFRPILYQNSGDIPIYGDKHRVVGYQSIAILEKQKDDKAEFYLSEIHKRMLLEIGRNAIHENLGSNKKAKWQYKQLPNELMQSLGAFVSIYIGEQLRGCIGKIESEHSLAKTIHDMAISAATKDSRFKAITKEEFSDLKIEISILSPLKKIESPSEIIPGKHGILLRKDYRSGTFLPQVAQKTSWNSIQLLEECSVSKAGLGRNGWKEAEIFIYEALVFSS